jgi:ABC-type lipoprotein export system ATPase subunit
MKPEAAQPQPWLVETIDLTRVYGDGAEIRALDGANLRIAAGELVAVMGPSGSGKSTLLNILGALDRPTSGRVLIDGQDLSELRDKDAFRARTVGFIFQLHNLLPTMTARENIEIPMIGIVTASVRKQRATQLLAQVGLEDRSHHLPGQLSGGQRQRVAVARALANQPRLVLADEPTGNLDTAAGQDLLRLIKEINQNSGTTFLLVTHDPAVARLTQRVIAMQDGRIVREDLVSSPIEEDLKFWRHSRLGQRIVEHDPAVQETLGLNDQQLAILRQVFQKVNRLR